MAASLNRLGSTLAMIGKDDEAGVIKQRAAQVNEWRADQNVESEAFHALVDDLLMVENVAANLSAALRLKTTSTVAATTAVFPCTSWMMPA